MLTVLLLLTIILLIIFQESIRKSTQVQNAIDSALNLLLPSPNYYPSQDLVLMDSMLRQIEVIIGESRFKDLVKLFEVSQLVFTGYNSGLPYIALTVITEDINEKEKLEHVLKHLFVQSLKSHGLYEKVIIHWSENYSLKLPVIVIRYALTKEQGQIIKNEIELKAKSITKKYMGIKDKHND